MYQILKFYNLKSWEIHVLVVLCKLYLCNLAGKL